MKGVALKLGRKGDAQVQCGDETFHVGKVLPGEVVEIDQGSLHAIVIASAERVAPFCPYYARCGGCKFQHWQQVPYAAWKRQLLLDALAERGINTDARALVDAHGEGRRRVSLHVREQDGVWQAGFMAQKSHDLIALSHCPVLVPALRDAPQLAAAFGPALGACDVAVTAADNGLDVAVKAERRIVLRRFEAMNAVVQQFGIIRLSVNGETHVELARPVVQMGRASATLPVQSFLQATRVGEESLAGLVTGALTSAKVVADLFCGLGPFALRLAERARVTAIDQDRVAIVSLDAARRNTQGLKPVTAEARDLFREPLTPAELKPFDAVVLDPPRAGAEAQARMLAKSSVARIVMVACDVASFARDASLLLAGGYKLLHVTPVDQFKWTAHVEMVGVFVKT
jgi:23S rRNA (uracil1939-C5)-methyltransferase